MMDKNKMKNFADGLNDVHHVILGLCGATLLVLPCLVDMGKNQSNNMFIASMVLLGYSAIVGGVSLKHKIKKAGINNKIAEEKRLINKNIVNQRTHIK